MAKSIVLAPEASRLSRFVTSRSSTQRSCGGAGPGFSIIAYAKSLFHFKSDVQTRTLFRATNGTRAGVAQSIDGHATPHTCHRRRVSAAQRGSRAAQGSIPRLPEM